jgi:hypothetical protein
MREEIKSGQAEMKSTVCAMRPELEESIQREMRAIIHPIWSEFNDTTSCNEATETKPEPGMMQSIRLQKYSDPKKLWTPENIGRHQQEEDQPCNSGMAQ